MVYIFRRQFVSSVSAVFGGASMLSACAPRPKFAAAIGVPGPDLVVRFGRGPALPPSLRRPVTAVLV